MYHNLATEKTLHIV